MAYTHQLQFASDYTTFGLNPTGPFTGPVDGIIASPTTFEPSYYVNSEFVNGNPVINWISGNRGGAGALLEGDGTPAFVSEHVLEMKLRMNTPPSYGPGGFLFQIGQNGAGIPGHLSAIYQGFQLKFQWGVANANATQIAFNSLHPVYIASISGAFHKFRIECKQSTSGLFSAAAGDMKIYLDDVLQTPDTVGANTLGNYNGALTHYLTLGGLDNNNSMHMSIGDVFISSNSNAVSTFSNQAPTGVFNSVVQR